MEKKANHQAKVVRIESIRVHTNADTLELVDIPDTDYQVVVKKGEFKVGDLGVYIQPDSIVPQTEPFRFIWEGQIGIDGVVPEKRRRITVRKFRKEYSEGLLLPLSAFSEGEGTLFRYEGEIYNEDFIPLVEAGTDVSEFLNITHYNPPEPIENFNGPQPKPYKWMPKSIRGWFFYLLRLIGLDPEKRVGGRPAPGPKNNPQVYDVESIRNYKHAFVDGEEVVATEKIHGSNARFQFSDGKMFAGSHYQWKHPDAKCIWNEALKQLPWIEEWCRANENYTLYGEVTPTQDGYRYGTTGDEVKFFIFDIMKPDGKFIEVGEPFPDTADYNYAYKFWVPYVYHGPFDIAKLKEIANEKKTSVPDADNPREGIVIQPVNARTVRGIGRLKLKLVSNVFLEKDNK